MRLAERWWKRSSSADGGDKAAQTASVPFQSLAEKYIQASAVSSTVLYIRLCCCRKNKNKINGSPAPVPSQTPLQRDTCWPRTGTRVINPEIYTNCLLKFNRAEPQRPPPAHLSTQWQHNVVPPPLPVSRGAERERTEQQTGRGGTLPGGRKS